MAPNPGDWIVVYPRPDHNVQEDGIIGRFLPPEGKQVMWSEWYHRRLRDGSIALTPFNNKPSPNTDSEE